MIFPTDGSPHLRDPRVQAQFKQAALDKGIQICSLAIGSPGKSRLPLHTNPAAAVLLVEAIDVARTIGTNDILLPVLPDSHIDMNNQREVETFVVLMKEVVRYAEKAGVVVALEDWISAEDNLRLLDAIGSDYEGVDYDARNIKSRVHDPYGEPANARLRHRADRASSRPPMSHRCRALRSHRRRSPVARCDQGSRLHLRDARWARPQSTRCRRPAGPDGVRGSRDARI